MKGKANNPGNNYYSGVMSPNKFKQSVKKYKTLSHILVIKCKGLLIVGGLLLCETDLCMVRVLLTSHHSQRKIASL